MRDLIGRIIANAAVINIAESVNLGREEGFEDIKRQIGAYQWSAILDDRTCFVAGTKILTDRGKLNIEQVRIGDFVMTRKGYQRVQEIMQKKYTGQMCKLKTAQQELCCTEDHLIWIQGKGWTKAKNVQLNDCIFNSKNNILFGKVLRFYERFRNSQYFNTTCAQKSIFLSILNPIVMPISAINLNSDSFTRNIKVNRFPAYLAFLDKFNFTLLQQNFDFCFNRSFASESTITCKRAKSSSIFAIWGNSKGFITVQAVNNKWRSTACFRAIMAGMCIFSGIVKDLSASFASNVKSLRCSTFKATKYKTIYIRFRYLKRFIAFWTYFYNMLILIPTKHTAIFFRSRDTGINRLITGLTHNKFTGFSGCIITCLRAVFFTAQRTIKDFFADITDIFMLRSHSIKHIIRYQAQQVNVYNLEIKNDSVYFANDILVHNCRICESLDGTYFEPGDPALAELKPPVHLHCRCILVAVLKEELEKFPVRFTFLDRGQVNKLIVNKI